VIDQDFALVISGAIPTPGVGTVILDRSAYRAPSVIKITLIDSDLAGHTSATVSARSTTDPPEERRAYSLQFQRHIHGCRRHRYRAGIRRRHPGVRI